MLLATAVICGKNEREAKQKDALEMQERQPDLETVEQEEEVEPESSKKEDEQQLLTESYK